MSTSLISWLLVRVRPSLARSTSIPLQRCYLHPRIIRGAAAIQDTIAKGVSAGEIAYVDKGGDGKYSPFAYGTGLLAAEVEISEDVFLIRKETADAHQAAQTPPAVPIPSPATGTQPANGETPTDTGPAPNPLVPTPGLTQPELFPRIEWSGEVPSQKWMNFYTKVVSKFAAGQGVKLKVTFEAQPEGGVSKQRLEETRAALRELGLDGDVTV